jgi:hypothetical protein
MNAAESEQALEALWTPTIEEDKALLPRGMVACEVGAEIAATISSGR